MLTPRINFRYSYIYDKNMEEWTKPYRARYHYKYPSEKEVEQKLKSYERVWSPYSIKILSDMSKVYGLKWKEKVLECYIVGFVTPFSDPLTLHSHYSSGMFVDRLTHELIHQMQGQNEDETEPIFKWLYKKYPKETENTKNHIPVHAVHAQICLDLFDEARLKKIIKGIPVPDYIRAWEIVQEEGHENLIKEFRKRIR
jgi:hypothetical protein